MRGFRSLICVLGMMLLPGCATDRTEETKRLMAERNGIQDQLNDIAPRSRWAQHPDTERMLERRDQIDQEINELK
jgi:hypothetical protein